MEKHGFSDSLNYNYKHCSEEYHVSRIIYHIQIFYLIKQLLLRVFTRWSLRTVFRALI